MKTERNDRQHRGNRIASDWVFNACGGDKGEIIIGARFATCRAAGPASEWNIFFEAERLAGKTNWGKKLKGRNRKTEGIHVTRSTDWVTRHTDCIVYWREEVAAPHPPREDKCKNTVVPEFFWISRAHASRTRLSDGRKFRSTSLFPNEPSPSGDDFSPRPTRVDKPWATSKLWSRKSNSKFYLPLHGETLFTGASTGHSFFSWGIFFALNEMCRRWLTMYMVINFAKFNSDQYVRYTNWGGLKWFILLGG